jgi:tRNA A37 N6-isopentenylltransferase MiaA
MIQKAVIATRQYAKRQMTWFRHHGQPNVVVSNVADIKIEDITK